MVAVVIGASTSQNTDRALHQVDGLLRDALDDRAETMELGVTRAGKELADASSEEIPCAQRGTAVQIRRWLVFGQRGLLVRVRF